MKDFLCRWFKRFSYLYCKYQGDRDETDKLFGVWDKKLDMLINQGKLITNTSIREVKVHWWQV